MLDSSSHNHPITSTTVKVKLEQDELSDSVGCQSEVKVKSEAAEFDDIKSSVDEQSTDESSDDDHSRASVDHSSSESSEEQSSEKVSTQSSSKKASELTDEERKVLQGLLSYLFRFIYYQEHYIHAYKKNYKAPNVLTV